MVGFIAPAGSSAEIPQNMAVNPITPENTPGGSFGDIVEASYKNSTYWKSLDYLSYKKQEADEAGQPVLSPEQIQDKYGFKADGPMTNAAAAFHQRRVEAEQTYDAVSRNASGVKSFGANTAAFFLDPINDATMLIPFAGEARVAGLMGKAGISAETALGRAAVRSAAFGGLMATQQAPLSVLNYGINNAAHMDYTIADGLRETLFAGAVGAITGPFVGAIGEAFRGTPQWARITRSNIVENEAAAKAGLNQMKNELPFDVEPVLNQERGNTPTFSDAFNNAQTRLTYQLQDLEGYRQQNANIIGQKELYAPTQGQPENEAILKAMPSLEARLADINESLKSPVVPPDWRSVMEEYRNRLQATLEQATEFKDMHDNELHMANWRGEMSMEDVIKRQAQLIKEGTVMGMPQEELRGATGEADALSKVPEDDFNTQLEHERGIADQLEESLKNSHAGNAELEADFKDAMSHKDNEAMYHTVFDAAVKCMTGVGYV